MTATTIETRRSIRTVVVALLVALSAVFMTAAPAHAATNATREQAFLDKVNAARVNKICDPTRSLPRLTMVSDLRTVAREHTPAMVRSNKLFHNPELTTDVAGWMRLAENVAYGSTVRSVHKNLMNSSGHRANICSPHLTEIGIGVRLDASGRVWVTEVFRQPF